MYNIAEIKKMNRKVAKKAGGKKPYIVKENGEITGMIPNFGNYRPKGFTLVETYFVDSSNYGRPGEAALTFDEFREKVKKGFGYAIIEQGQFQVYVGEFEKE